MVRRDTVIIHCDPDRFAGASFMDDLKHSTFTPTVFARVRACKASRLIKIPLLVILFLFSTSTVSFSGHTSSYCEATAEVIGKMSSERSREARQRIDAHLEKGGSVNDVIQPLFGTTFLHNASLSGDVENVRYLLSRGAEVNAQDINGGTPIISAVVGCHLDVATLLMEHGADPKMRDKTIGTAIELARRTKQKKMRKILKRR
jgi:hypothetical protein